METNSIQLSSQTAQFIQLMNEYNKVMTDINDFIGKIQGVNAYDYYPKFYKGDELIGKAFRKMLGNMTFDSLDSSKCQQI